MKRILMTVLALTCLSLGTNAEDKAWSNTADLSMTMTSGNSETENLSLSNKYKRKWDKIELSFLAKAVRAEATKTVYANVNGSLMETSSTEPTAESYQLGLKTKGKLIGDFQWYLNTGWFQDELAGIDTRINIGGGFGYTLIDNDSHKLASEFGFEFTDETPVIGESDSFGSLRGFLDYERPLSQSAKFTADAEILSNMDNSDDLRSNLNFGLTSNINTMLALKLGYSIKYDGDPIKEELSDANNAAAPVVIREYDKTDTVLSMSLVLNM